MQNIAILFEFIAFLLAVLAAIILFFVNKEQRHSNRILALVLLTLALATFNAVLLYTGSFLLFPRLHKMAVPFSLLIYPAAYLYVRSVLLGELKFRKNDWWLLIATVLCAINLMPYYLMPLEEKRVILTEIHKDSRIIAHYSEGIFPRYVFSFVRVVWCGLFVSLNFILIRRFKNRAVTKVLVNNRELLSWLSVFNVIMTGILVAALFVAINAAVNKTSYIIVDLAVGISTMFICIQLFIRPKLLYGVFQPLPEVASVNRIEQMRVQDLAFPKILITATQQTNGMDQSSSELNVGAADSYRYKKTIETLFLHQTPFLQPDYSLEQLVKDSAIPRYTLSAFINREYGMGFREFLNRYRVNFFKDNLSNPLWKNLTLEAIAEQCGFSSRNTFIKNFKEITGQTPSEFIKTSNNTQTA